MKNLLGLLIIFNSAVLLAQDAQIAWQKSIGGSNNDPISIIRKTDDGGFILGGWSDSDTSGDKTENSQGGFDYWVVKVDSQGDLEWQNTIGGSGDELLQFIDPTMEGGYVLGGFSDSNISGDKTEDSQGFYDYWIVKLDENGTIEWQNTIGGNDYDMMFSVYQTADGGYIVGGNSQSGISGDKTEDIIGTTSGTDYWILKLNVTGAIEWQNTIGGAGSEDFKNMLITDDGGYIIGGSSASDAFADKTEDAVGGIDYWIVKLNDLGDVVWDNTIGGTERDGFSKIKRISDGGYLLVGNSKSNISGDKDENSLGEKDYWILKLDALGEIVWQNTIGGSDEDFARDGFELANGGFFVGGWSISDASGDKSEDGKGESDNWILELDANGDIVNDNTIGGSLDDFFTTGLEVAPGEYAISSASYSDTSGDKTVASNGGQDYWVIGLSEFLSVETFIEDQLSVYPNPVTNEITIQYDGGGIEGIGIYSTLGAFIGNLPVSDRLDVSFLSSGVYFLQINISDKTMVKKFIKL